MKKVSIFWHRRDLRFFDNAGLYEALKGESPVLPIFIFDKHILDKLEDKDDARVTFIHNELKKLKQKLEEQGKSMHIYYGFPEEIWPKVLEQYKVDQVYTNRDYEPYAKERDEKVKDLLDSHNIPFHTFKDHVIFEVDEVQKNTGGTYTVFTPYSRKWKAKLLERIDTQNGEDISYYFKSYPSADLLAHCVDTEALPMPSLEEMGFVLSSLYIPERTVNRGLIKKYDETRNFPAINGTSRLGIHFRFGTISIREKAQKAMGLNETYLNELIWRDFYSQILSAFPHVMKNSFRPEYEYIQWRNDEADFQKWCEGKTGYPIVDAGMRELNETGYMHNRVRMITASFLTKHLLIDWRWGEAYFARKLLDFDLSSNNGGWQWASGSGTDAAPYFRIFNPTSQLQKFDKELKYVRRWVKEYGTAAYPEPMVDHKMARERCLEVYKAGLEIGKASV